MLTNNIYFLNMVLKAGEPMQFSVGSSIALLHERRFLPVSSQGRRDKVMLWCPFHMDTSPTDKDSTCMTQSSLRDPAWFLKNADLASSHSFCTVLLYHHIEYYSVPYLEAGKWSPPRDLRRTAEGLKRCSIVKSM